MNWFYLFKSSVSAKDRGVRREVPMNMTGKPYGYWIKPDGSIITVQNSLDHSRIALQSGLGKEKDDAMNKGNLHVTTSPMGVGVAFNKWPNTIQWQKASDLMTDTGLKNWDVIGPNFRTSVEGIEPFSQFMRTRKKPAAQPKFEVPTGNYRGTKLDPIRYKDTDDDENYWKPKKPNTSPANDANFNFLRMLGEV